MSGAGPRELNVYRLGRVGYEPTLKLQERLLELRIKGEVGDTLLLLEHAPVITLGRGAKDEHVLLSRERLAAQGVDLFETGRGGDVTYHGPGQLVGYPILDLKPDRRDVRKYVAGLEELMIRVCGDYGLGGARIEGLNGAWIGNRKVGAVGVRIRQWVTMHGFALNANTDLTAFDLIVPCGIQDKEVTSLSRELSKEVDLGRVMDSAARHCADVYGRKVVWHDGPPEV